MPDQRPLNGMGVKMESNGTGHKVEKLLKS